VVNRKNDLLELAACSAMAAGDPGSRGGREIHHHEEWRQMI